MIATAYTPRTLADRWNCSERHVRNMIADGELPAFRLGGKLLRIRSEDVEKIECQSGASADCGESSASPGQMQTASADVIDLALTTAKKRSAAPRLDTQSSRVRSARR
jgi:excisionase family DNA binding protein